MNEITNKKSSEAHRKKVEMESAEGTAAALEGQKLIIKAKAGANDRLFGSVTTKEIAGIIKEKTGQDIDRRKIVLDKDIKQFGQYEVDVKIYSGVSAKIIVSVEP